MTREEALNVTKDVHHWLQTDREKEALEILIPELVESDDERVRRWIKKEIEDKYVVEGIVNNKLADEAFGWLEKQKHLYETTKDRFYHEGFEEGQLYEKQKEQKPIKWTDLTWKDIVELEGIINNVHYDFRNGIGQESFGKEVLERFREYKGDEYLDEIEQKPEEDEELTEFEKAVGLVFTDAQLIPRDKDGIANIHDIDEFIKKKAAELLAIAKKELKNNVEADYKELPHERYEQGKTEALKKDLLR